MKNSVLLLLFSFCANCLAAQSFNFTVTADKMNVLYAGIDNPVTIIAGNCPSDKLIVKVTQGELIGGVIGWHYMYRCSEPADIRFSLYKKTKHGLVSIGVVPFRVRGIPTPDAKVGPSAGGNISKVLFKSQCYMRAEIEGFNIDVRFIIDSFTTTIIHSKDSSYQKITNEGNKFNATIKAAFENLDAGDVVLFDNIYAEMPDKTERRLSPIVFTISVP